MLCTFFYLKYVRGGSSNILGRYITPAKVFSKTTESFEPFTANQWVLLFSICLDNRLTISKG